MERRSARFEGRVQGVSFRATACSIAGGHRVTGWVRNEADGSVQMEVQGPREEIDAYLASLQGRMGRFIQRAVVSPITVLEGERGFDIRR